MKKEDIIEEIKYSDLDEFEKRNFILKKEKELGFLIRDQLTDIKEGMFIRNPFYEGSDVKIKRDERGWFIFSQIFGVVIIWKTQDSDFPEFFNTKEELLEAINYHGAVEC